MDLQGTQNGDTLTGGADSDTIYGFGGNDTLKGLAGDDVLAGHDGNDILQGGAGDDYLLGGAGNDTIDGGDGNDWAAYEDATAGVKVDLNITGSQNTIGGGTDKLTGIENVYGSAFNDTLTGNAGDNMLVGDAGNDTISGGKGNDTLWGDAGNDVLDGGDGDDYIVGGAGDDIIKGGAGVDWSSYENATAGVTVDLNKTTAQDTIGAGKDTITGVELLYGSKFDDVLTGDAKDNYLWGGDGNDKLYGGAGDDHLSGGKGYNVISGGDGFDTVDYSFSDKGVTIDLNQGPPPMGGAPWNYDVISSVEAAMGSAYDDVIWGNSSENYLFGDAGNDVIYAVGGMDTLDGGDGDDKLVSSASGSGDLLLGGKGDDHFWIGSGAGTITIEGGEGSDTLYLPPIAGNQVFDLRITGPQTVSAGLTITATGIENLIGGSGDDKLTGDAKDNILTGGRGNDVLDGGAGNDTVSYANDGAVGDIWIDLTKTTQAFLGNIRGTDTLISIENVIGGSGNDYIAGNAAVNRLYGGDGNDSIDLAGGGDFAYGGYGNDIIKASKEAGGDYMAGEAGDDVFFTQKFGVTMDGGLGNDMFHVLHTTDTTGVFVIDGGEGVDTLDLSGTYLPASNLNVDLRIVGKQDVGQGHMIDVKNVENVTGGLGNDKLIGDAKNNILRGVGGVDVLDGGAGLDLVGFDYDLTTLETGVKIDLRNSVQTDLGGRGTVTLISIEGAIGTDYDDVLIGDAKDNLFIGGKGANIIDGGDGVDTVSYVDIKNEDDGMDHVLFVNLKDGNALNYHSQDTLISIENVVGSNYTDHITGSAAINVLKGGLGGDNLFAVGEGDSLFGEDGNDWLEQDRSGANVLLDGGAGDDRLLVFGDTSHALVSGGDGIDTIYLNAAADAEHGIGVTFRLGLMTAQDITGKGAAVTVYGVENIVGSMASDHLYGDDRDNVITGSQGDDVIDGGAGFDIADYSLDEAGAVNIDLRVALQQSSAQGADTLISIEGVVGSNSNDTLIGNDQNNLLSGLRGNDVLDGGAGDDVLIGGYGADIMTGGAGADIFKFFAGEDGFDPHGSQTFARIDVITDFSAVDKLAFAGAPPLVTADNLWKVGVFDATPGTDPLAGAMTAKILDFAHQYEAGTSNQKYMIITVGQDTYVLADTDGVKAYDQIILLKNVSSSLITADMFMAA